MIRTNKLYLKRDSLRKWFHSPIRTYEGLVKDKKGKYITHGDFVSQLYKDVRQIITKHGYHLKEKNVFKNELVRYIYKLSDDSK